MQKSIWSTEEQIKKMSSGCKNQHVDNLTELEAEIQEITANIQVWISHASNIGVPVAFLHRLRLFSCQGYQHGAVLVSAEAGGRGEERPEGEKREPRRPEVPQDG